MSVVPDSGGGVVRSRTAQEKKNGEYSYQFDCTSNSLGDWFYINCNVENRYEISKSDLLVEFYIKCENDNLSALRRKIGFSSKSGAPIPYFTNVSMTTDDADSDGWRRVWCVIPAAGMFEYGMFTVELSYDKVPGVDMGIVYYDQFSVKTIPVSIKINDMTCSEPALSLNDVTVRGDDIFGESSRLYKYDVVKYTVTGGSAFIDDNNNLVYNNINPGKVSLQADFYGVTTTFSVDFSGGQSVSLVEREDGGCDAHILNNSPKNVELVLTLCLFDGERLSQIAVCEKLVAGGTSDIIRSDAISVFGYVANPQIRAFYRIRQ